MTFPPPTMNASVGGFPPPSEGTIGNIPPPPPPDQVSIGGFPPPQAKSGLPNIAFPPPQENIGYLTQAYRSTLKPVLEYFRDNEVESTKLIPIEDYVPPKPTTDPTVASFQILNNNSRVMSDFQREAQMNELSKLVSEKKLFSQEGVDRLAKTGVDPEYATKVLLTGLGEAKKFRRDISFQQALKEGHQESATGILTGSGIKDYETLLQRAESEIPFLKRQTKNLSKLLGDLPAFGVGGAYASIPVGGPTTPWGAVLAMAGAFSTQALIDSAHREALRLKSMHPELKADTLEEFSDLVTHPEAWQGYKNIAGDMLEAGTVGALVAVNPIFKAVAKTPVAKLFNIPVVLPATKLLSEAAGFTLIPSLLHGKIPTAEDFLDNTILIGGVHLSIGAAHKLAQWAERKKVLADDVVSRLGAKFTAKDEAAIANARTPEEVDAITAEVEGRPEKSSVQTELEASAKELVGNEGGKEAPEKLKQSATEQRATDGLDSLNAEEINDKNINLVNKDVSDSLSNSFPTLKQGRMQNKTQVSGMTEKGVTTEWTDLTVGGFFPDLGVSLFGQGKTLGEAKQDLFLNIEKSTDLKRSNAKEAPAQKLKSVEPKSEKLDVSEKAKGKETLEQLTPQEEDQIVSNQKSAQAFLNKKPKTVSEANEYLKELNQAMEKAVETINKHKKTPNYKKDALMQAAVKVLQDRAQAFLRRFNQTKEAIAQSKDGTIKMPAAPRVGLVQPEQAERKANPQGKGEKANKKSEIMNLFKEAFKDTPFRLGKFPPGLKRRANGYYHLGNNVIRLREAGMIETAAHELGHKLHMALFGGGDKYTLPAQIKNINAALKPYMHELKPISRYAPHEMEGFAEFVRMYVTKPESAKLLAPEFLKFFEAEMKAKAPEALDLLHQAREMHEKWLDSSPVARVYAHIQSGYDTTMFARAKDWLKGILNLDKIKTALLDEYFPIKRAVADTIGIEPVQVENWVSPMNAYVAARTLKGWVGKAEMFLTKETFSALTLDANGKGLKEILDPIDTTAKRQQLSAYLVAKRSMYLPPRGLIVVSLVNTCPNRFFSAA